jgi:hypothetical protein
MFSRTTFVLFCFLLTALFIQAAPQTVVVGDLTFVRPKNWKLEEPGATSTAQARFLVPDDQGKVSGTVDVRFYIEDKEGLHDDATWKSHFPTATSAQIREERKSFGTRELSILTLQGTYATPEAKVKKRENFYLVSATITFGPKVIRVRILGPKSVVQPASATFQSMVENALGEKAR